VIPIAALPRPDFYSVADILRRYDQPLAPLAEPKSLVLNVSLHLLRLFLRLRHVLSWHWWRPHHYFCLCNDSACAEDVDVAMAARA
jgi:hypothetical protein